MAKAKPSPEQQVADYIAALQHPLKEVVLALRSIMLTVDPTVAEQIKWNSLSYYYTGDMLPFDPKEYKRDIVVFNLHKQDSVLLVFPTGAKVNDTTGLLQGKFPDGRKTASFSSIEEVNKQSANLQAVVTQWIQLIDK